MPRSRSRTGGPAPDVSLRFYAETSCQVAASDRIVGPGEEMPTWTPRSSPSVMPCWRPRGGLEGMATFPAPQRRENRRVARRHHARFERRPRVARVTANVPTCLLVISGATCSRYPRRPPYTSPRGRRQRLPFGSEPPTMRGARRCILAATTDPATSRLLFASSMLRALSRPKPGIDARGSRHGASA